MIFLLILIVILTPDYKKTKIYTNMSNEKVIKNIYDF